MINVEIIITRENPRQGVYNADAKESPQRVSQTVEISDYATKTELADLVAYAAVDVAGVFNFNREVPLLDTHAK